MNSREHPWVARTMLFVPAHREDLINKAAHSAADCIVLDLQDATPPNKKAAARDTTAKILRSGLLGSKTTMVRVNAPGTDLFQADVESIVCERLDGVVCPMVNSSEDIKVLDETLGEVEAQADLNSHTPIVALLETPSGILNAHPIACSSRRVIGLMFGAEDFLVEMGTACDAEGLILHTPRALVAMAARAAGVEAIDTPYVDVHDLDGLKRHAERGRSLGMSGILVLSPRQIDVAHVVFSPSEEEVRRAQEAILQVNGVQETGQSYALVDGELVAPAREKRARRVLARNKAIRKMEQESQTH